MTETPAETVTEPTPRNRKRSIYIGLAGVAALGIIAAAIAIPMTLSAKAEETRISDAAEKCALTKGSYTILDDGGAIEFDGAGLEKSGIPVGPEPEKVLCVMLELGAPQSVSTKVGQTRALDGTRETAWDGYAAQWTYHPDDGMNMLIEKVKS